MLSLHKQYEMEQVAPEFLKRWKPHYMDLLHDAWVALEVGDFERALGYSRSLTSLEKTVAKAMEIVN